MTVINTNVGALMARTYATKANEKMSRSMERLSSGQRINSAADDAAGLAVANKMESQQRGISMAMRNSRDGVSLVQTAESAMTEITNMVLRMRELAIQMDNGVYTGTDRDNAQLEINALLAEIDKIAENTRFNDVKLLDGSYDQTIRAGNTNAETTRITLNSMFIKDTGAGAGATLSTEFATGPVAASPAHFTTDFAVALSNQLGIESTDYGSLNATDSEAVLSNIVSSDDFGHHGDNILLLKDNINSVGYTYAAVSITDSQWSQVSSNLSLTKKLHEEIASLDPLNAVSYMDAVANIRSNLADLEVERSRYIGSLFHSNEIDHKGVHVEGLSNNKYAEILNVYSDPATRQSITGEIAAIEVDFQELAKTLHDPLSCRHCIAKAAAGGDSAAAAGGSEGVSPGGDVWAAANASVSAAGSSSATAASPSSNAVSPLIKGSKWTNVGDDSSAAGGANNLSYSYWDGTTNYSASDPVAGTKTTLDSHATGTNNQTAHDKIFELWDAVAPFSLDKITESGNAGAIGDLRVAVTDSMPGGAAAFAYYPSSSPVGGDIYYGQTQVMGTSTDTDFVEGEYNWVTALHEIGHALGLSHPFDGGSSDGSKLDLNLDGQRNTVMTYVQRDRNRRIYMNGSTATTGGLINTSTPGLLDIEAIEHLYGSTNWSHNASNTTYGSGAGSDAFDNNYESIRVISDSGGTDTLNASGVTATGSIIDLTPGTYSSINYYATDALKIASLTSDANQIAFFENYVSQQNALASASSSKYQAFTRSALYRGQENVGIAHNTWIENAIGGDGADTITGNNKGNEITGNNGNDTIDGSGGTDVSIYSEAYANYSISSSGGTVTVSHTGGSANEGTDTLKNIEYIKFSDGYYDVATATWNNGGTVPGLTGSETGGKTGGVANGASAINVAGMTLKDIKIQSAADAQAAVLILDKSLEQISAGRAKLGAVSNRLAHNLDNQTQASMMSQQARGRVVDTDMAVESTALAQEMILAQAAQQAINMARQRQLTVLALLET
ncbi:flagellin [Alphaproteobacteria bacterium]|nr:flagellin [Alphaproteobacteria bacterium]